MTICGFQETGGHPVKNKATRLNKGFYEVLYKNNCSVLFCHPFQAIFSADSLRKAAPIGWNHKLHSFQEYQNFRINFTFIPYIYFFPKPWFKELTVLKRLLLHPVVPEVQNIIQILRRIIYCHSSTNLITHFTLLCSNLRGFFLKEIFPSS